MVQHAPALFLADALGLDFLNSIATPLDREIDWIEDGDGLLSWLEQAEAAPPRVLAELREQALPGELDKLAAQARSLREELRTFVHQRRGRPLPPEDLGELAPLNRLLARDEQFLQLTAGPEGAPGLHLHRTRRWRSPDALLQPIAEALARFLSEENFVDVKACEGPACTLMFVDHTRGRVRRWCSMAICGNRAKQAAHRTRLKTTSGAGSTA
ncbi:CGNR zinc finger domain-containing protein [Streptomyces sp. NBC_01198]|uniref:CGNR zinc finger domain-containing protein n=1 Tax=Streptomyces sp. NBC_01198 TaxID=2903769 RepID=UPI002E0E2B69|nr:CGNR zinc finger domain-containing protein [Streptomyces sp. NBC_01198]